MVFHKAPVLANLFFCVIDLPRYEEACQYECRLLYNILFKDFVDVQNTVHYYIWAYRTKIESNRSVAIMLDTIVQD